MFAAPCSDRKIRIIAMTLVVALCLPLLSGALAATGPSAPRSLTAATGDGQIALVWFAPENDGGAAITSYQVSMDGGAAWTDIGLGTSYTYSGLDSGLMYMFMVRAVNSAGSGDEAITTAKPSGSGAETTPTPAPTGGLDALIDSWFGSTPTPAPADGGTGTGAGGGQGVRPGGGGQGTGEGQKPGDQPQNPPQPPPDIPAKPPTRAEENIPVEIDPKDVTEKPLKPKKEKMQKAETVWTVTAEGIQTFNNDNAMKYDGILDFRAIKVDDSMYGAYTGNGTLNMVMDQAQYHAMIPTNTGEYAADGRLTNIQFTLEKTKGEPDAAYRRAMAEYEKSLDEYDKYTVIWHNVYRGTLDTILRYNDDARDENGRVLWDEVVKPNLKWLMDRYEEEFPRPPKPKRPQNKNAYSAIGKGTMFWDCSMTQNHFVTKDGYTGQSTPLNPMSLPFEIILYASGNGVVKINFDPFILTYKARLVKSVQMVDVD